MQMIFCTIRLLIMLEEIRKKEKLLINNLYNGYAMIFQLEEEDSDIQYVIQIQNRNQKSVFNLIKRT